MRISESIRKIIKYRFETMLETRDLILKIGAFEDWEDMYQNLWFMRRKTIRPLDLPGWKRWNMVSMRTPGLPLGRNSGDVDMESR